MSQTIEILDSTLRDGAQGEGIAYSSADKRQIVRLLSAIGIRYIEAGNPASNPKDAEFFSENTSASVVAFGSTRRKNTVPEACPNVTGLLAANTAAVSVFGKCWDLHVKEILNTTPDENLAMIADTVDFFARNGRRVIFDAEHFFDGYKADKGYALQCLAAARNAGAEVLCLCDTNGGTMTEETVEIVHEVVTMFPFTTVGIHCHNDSGLAVANTIAGVAAGARHIQGTFIGIGERCGNANLSTVIPNLQLKLGYSLIPEDKMPLLTETAKAVAELSNVPLQASSPFVGRSAFTHKAGMHADGVLKASHSFEHVSPDSVGNERRFLLSEIAGRGVILDKLKKHYPGLTKDAPELARIAEVLKEQENRGYQYEGAEASFQLLVKKTLGKYEPAFQLVSYKSINEQPAIEGNIATAILKIRVDGEAKITASEGNGPVHALDRALRLALKAFYPVVENVTLLDYKVRVLGSSDATAATVRVLITSTDGKDVWTTVGVSTDVIEASWIALVDSFEYKILIE